MTSIQFDNMLSLRKCVVFLVTMLCKGQLTFLAAIVVVRNSELGLVKCPHALTFLLTLSE
jgi:hypothetical protein